jgi:hypothetical protein
MLLVTMLGKLQRCVKVRSHAAVVVAVLEHTAHTVRRVVVTIIVVAVVVVAVRFERRDQRNDVVNKVGQVCELRAASV